MYRVTLNGRLILHPLGTFLTNALPVRRKKKKKKKPGTTNSRARSVKFLRSAFVCLFLPLFFFIFRLSLQVSLPAHYPCSRVHIYANNKTPEKPRLTDRRLSSILEITSVQDFVQNFNRECSKQRNNIVREKEKQNQLGPRNEVNRFGLKGTKNLTKFYQA